MFVRVESSANDDRAKRLRWLLEYLVDKLLKRFFGTVEIRIEHGKITHVEVRETLKPGS